MTAPVRWCRDYITAMYGSAEQPVNWYERGAVFSPTVTVLLWERRNCYVCGPRWGWRWRKTGCTHPGKARPAA